MPAETREENVRVGKRGGRDLEKGLVLAVKKTSTCTFEGTHRDGSRISLAKKKLVERNKKKDINLCKNVNVYFVIYSIVSSQTVNISRISDYKKKIIRHAFLYGTRTCVEVTRVI